MTLYSFDHWDYLLLVWVLVAAFNVAAFWKELKALKGRTGAKDMAAKCFILTIVVTGPIFWVVWFTVGILIPMVTGLWQMLMKKIFRPKRVD